ncbi:MAG TPA: hypothetical protein VNL70_02905 [Tepidisphaeraceae bacterium]|nr:hypothetical protein [Tepidisphaeraceae bacterium]
MSQELARDRLEKLLAMLGRQPDDPFLLYALAMEYKKLGEHSLAIEYFNRTIEADSNCCYAYYHRGQVQELAGQIEQARLSYRQGIQAAGRAGDEHARAELESALQLLEQAMRLG